MKTDFKYASYKRIPMIMANDLTCVEFMRRLRKSIKADECRHQQAKFKCEIAKTIFLRK